MANCEKPVKNIVVLVSGGGTNLQALIEAEKSGEIYGGKISCVISSKEDAYALVRAEKNNIKTRVIPRKNYDNSNEYSEAILAALLEEKADLIVLAGFMTILGEQIIKAFPYKIINVHPALIPSFCGQGFYGLKVHEAALEYGVKVSGATVHFVNEEADAGAIILQKPVEVKNDDTPEVLQKRIMEEAEWKILPAAIDLIANGKVSVQDGKVIIEEK